MKMIEHAGLGPKKKVEQIPVGKLLLDPDNPRLPEDSQGATQSKLLEVLFEDFDLEELAFSMAQNGYFDEEPMVAVRKVAKKSGSKDGEYIVVEGNRRLATIKILLDLEARKQLGIHNWPSLQKEVAEDLSALPVIVYDSRDDVLPYLGVRHISGIKRWDTYAKARYVANMVQAGYDMDVIQQQIGDRQNSARKHYLCYKLAEQVRDNFDFDLGPVKENFSFLMLATGQGSIKRYLGLPVKLAEANLEEPISKAKLRELKNLFSFVFGEGKAKPPVITESRDITNYLSAVLASEKATSFLVSRRNLESAYELSDGEEVMIRKYLSQANSKLEAVLGIVHRHRTADILEEIKKCSETVRQLVKVTSKETE